jgi:selenocysteine lyase/cysteine desulfurase
VAAVAVKKRFLPRGVPFETGGGTTKLYDKEWVIWADEPDRFEAGTPAIINVIAFAKALLMTEKGGGSLFSGEKLSPVTSSEIFRDEFSELKGTELLNKLKVTMPGLKYQVPSANGPAVYINFDNGASTPPFKPVWDVFKRALNQPRENRQEIIREVRKITASFLLAPENQYDIIFTSNTTEAVNLMASHMPVPQNGEMPVILNTILEHSSNDLPWRYIPGYNVIKLPVSKEGFWDLGQLEEILRSHNEDKTSRQKIRLVTVSGASNVVGSCNDLAATGSLAHRYGALFMVDAAQLVAHRAINMAGDGIDGLFFSAHKAYAPFGTGVLVVRKGIIKKEMVSGEENIGGIAAIGKALLLIRDIGFETIQEEEHRLMRRAMHGLSTVPGLELKGTADPDSPQMEQKTGILLFEMKNRMPGRIATRMAWHGAIGIRYGCHCAHLMIKYLTGFTPFQEKFQKAILLMFPMLKLQGFLRVSFGLGNRDEEVDQLIRVIREIAGNTLQPRTGLREIHRRMEAYAEEITKKVYYP